MITWFRNLLGGRKSGAYLYVSRHHLLRWTPSDAGITVNEHTALQLTAVSCCVRVIAETFGSLPLHVYRRTKNGREKAVEHPIYKLIHDQPNQYMTIAVYRETASAQLSTAGNHYSYISKSGFSCGRATPFATETDQGREGTWSVLLRNLGQRPASPA